MTGTANSKRLLRTGRGACFASFLVAVVCLGCGGTDENGNSHGKDEGVVEVEKVSGAQPVAPASVERGCDQIPLASLQSHEIRPSSFLEAVSGQSVTAGFTPVWKSVFRKNVDLAQHRNELMGVCSHRKARVVWTVKLRSFEPKIVGEKKYEIEAFVDEWHFADRADAEEYFSAFNKIPKTAEAYAEISSKSPFEMLRIGSRVYVVRSRGQFSADSHGKLMRLVRKLARKEQDVSITNDTGYLSVATKPASRIFVDGVFVQNSPLVRYELVTGIHEVRMVAKDGEIDRTVRVEIKRGRTATVVKELVPTK